MFLKKRLEENVFKYFTQLIDCNITLFGKAFEERLIKNEYQKLSDNEFVECYLDGMQRLLGSIHNQVIQALEGECESKQRFVNVLNNPGYYGFRFKNNEITIGKIYLSYVYGKTKKRASKSDCIKLEKYAIQLIGKECLKYGVVQ